MLKQFLFSLAVGGVLVCASCGGSAHESSERYVLVTANTRIPYWQAAVEGLQRAAAEMKVRADVVGPPRYDPKVEKQALENVIHDKPSGIMISAADPALLSDDIDSALQQGIPVITIDSDAPASKRLFFIGSDNYNTGKLGGQLVAKLLGGKGDVVVFTYPRQHNLTERLEGYQNVFDTYPNIKVTQAIDINGDPAIAYTTAKELLTSKARVDAFVCLEAVACPVVGDAVKETNMAGKVAIMAMDTDQRTLNWIKEDLVAATIAQKPYTMAYLGLKLLDDIYHHKPASLLANFAQSQWSPYPTFVDTGTFIVDKSNLSKFSQQSTPQSGQQ